MKCVQTFPNGDNNAIVDVPDFMPPPSHPRQTVVPDSHPVASKDIHARWDHEKKELLPSAKAVPAEPAKQPEPLKD